MENLNSRRVTDHNIKFGSALLTLLCLGILVYLNTLGNPFVHDDIVFILQNPQIRNLGDWQQVFNQPSVTAGQHLAVSNSYYRPILEIVYRWEFLLFGAHPFGYHVVNILLHILNGILVLFLTDRLTGQRRFAWAVAVLFIVHPVQSESVACIAGISNLAFSFFCLLSLLFYLKVIDRRGQMRPWLEMFNYTNSLFWFGVALLCKEQAVLLPIFVILYEFCFPTVSRFFLAGWRLRISGYTIVTAGYFLWRKLILGGFFASVHGSDSEMILRIKSIPSMLLTDLRLGIWPHDLHYYRSHDILAPWFIPALGLLIVLICYNLLERLMSKAQQGFLSYGVGWFVLGLFPVMIIPIIHEYSWIAAFEHFLYLPLVGFLWVVLMLGGFCADRLFGYASEAVKRSVFAAAVLASVLVTVSQNQTWASEITLFRNVLKYENHLGRVHLLLANAYFKKGDIEYAQREYSRAGLIMRSYLAKVKNPQVIPFYKGFMRDSWFGLAMCHLAAGRMNEAQSVYKEILKILPEDADTLNNLSFIAMRQGQWSQAQDYLLKALEKNPQNPQLLTNLGVCKVNVGDLTGAKRYFEQALDADPHFSMAQSNLKHLLEQTATGQNPTGN